MMGASCVLTFCTAATAKVIVGSTQKAPIVYFKAKLDANSHHFTYFSRKHPCVPPAYFLLLHH